MSEPAKTLTAYKGFASDLTCRGFQFTEGGTYEHDGDVALCSSGFHAVEQPLHALRYYPPNTSVYHLVQLEDVSPDRQADDSKVAARKITVGAKVSLAGLIEAQVEWVTSRAKPVKGSTSKADNGAATASGESGAATASGRYGAATADGDESIAIATGKNGRARGKQGTWIVLTERDDSWHILEVRAVHVDGQTVEADTFYTLRNGRVVIA